MIDNNKGPVLLEYSISPEVRAFSTCRIGGFGIQNYHSLNVTHYCGDDPLTVKKNTELLCEVLNIDSSRLVLPRQVHGVEVAEINETFFCLTEEERKSLLNGVDALITQMNHVCIGVSTADCVPILLYDPVTRSLAAVHAGWRGVVNNIIGEVIKRMQSSFGVSASHIKAVIGPSISKLAFEVGDEVYAAFYDAGFNMSAIASRLTFPGNEEKWHIDLWGACCEQLENLGISLDNMQIAGICTYQSSDEFFSARRLGLHSGRIFNGIMLNEV